MNIAFIANYTKTYFFNAIAEKLLREGITIKWIVVNKGNYDYLLKKYPKSDILYLPKNEILNSDNNPIGEFKLNELIYGDRVLKYQNEIGIKYLNNIQKPIFDFIKTNSIRYVFGEVTWAHEILIHRIANSFKELDCKYLEMFPVRIPNNRFAFFNSEYQDQFLIIDKLYREKELPNNAIELVKPSYFALMDDIVKKGKSLKERLKRVKAYITGENLDENDITLMPRSNKYRTLNPLRNELNKESYKRVKTIDYEFLKDKKFVLATLHKQPEASIDVLGRYVEDQTQNILNLWRIMPADWYLVVKEHSNALGDRSYSWFKNLAKYHNIIFANENLESHKLIALSQAVYTISGTVAYEAALMQKPALVLTNVFFQFPYVKKVDVNLFKEVQSIHELLNTIPDNSIDEVSLKKKIYFNSFEGNIGDPLNDPTCMDEVNINNVNNAILKLLRDENI